MRVLLVEDSLKLSTWLAKALKQHSFTVDQVHDGAEADALLRTEVYDAVILDLGLPSLDGVSILQRLRARGSSTPVIILTARGELADRVDGLNLGADDYLAKPFALTELEARLHAIIRRAHGVSTPIIRLGPLEYESSARLFRINGRRLQLRPKEHAVLEVLLMRMGKVVSKAMLHERVFSLETSTGQDVVEIYIHRLRKHFAQSGVSIVTLRGLGYVLETH